MAAAGRTERGVCAGVGVVGSSGHTAGSSSATLEAVIVDGVDDLLDLGPVDLDAGGGEDVRSRERQESANLDAIDIAAGLWVEYAPLTAGGVAVYDGDDKVALEMLRALTGVRRNNGGKEKEKSTPQRDQRVPSLQEQRDRWAWVSDMTRTQRKHTLCGGTW